MFGVKLCVAQCHPAGNVDPVAPPPTLVALPSDLARASGPIVASPRVRSFATANQRHDRDRSDGERALDAELTDSSLCLVYVARRLSGPYHAYGP